MFLTFLAVTAVAIGLIKLGALSVWVAVLSITLKAILALIFAVAMLFLWRRYKGNQGD